RPGRRALARRGGPRLDRRPDHHRQLQRLGAGDRVRLSPSPSIGRGGRGVRASSPRIPDGRRTDMSQAPTRRGPLPWEELRHRLDEGPLFNAMLDPPYYRDAVYEQFSAEEYARRYAALRDKMRQQNLDVAIVPGGPSHWSFGGGMQWLTGHWEWHALA